MDTKIRGPVQLHSLHTLLIGPNHMDYEGICMYIYVPLKRERREDTALMQLKLLSQHKHLLEFNPKMLHDHLRGT